MADQGYETKSFKPAYVKDKRQFKPDAPLKRSIGETIGGSLSPQQRREAAVNRSLMNQLDNLTRREEVMAAEALRLGQVTVTGDNYPTQVVSYQRDAALTITLTGGNRWGQAGIKPLDLIEDWATLVQSKSGAAARRCYQNSAGGRIACKNRRRQKRHHERGAIQSAYAEHGIKRGHSANLFAECLIIGGSATGRHRTKR